MILITNRLVKMWQTAAIDLKLEIETPFTLLLSSGEEVKGEILLKNFGATNGMIIIMQYDIVSPFIEEIVSMGYGFSVLDEPSEKEQYLQKDFVEILRDWDWHGEKCNRPTWLNKPF